MISMLDSNHFGMKVSRFEPLKAEEFIDFERFNLENSVDLSIIRLDSSSVDLQQEAQSQGFVYMDSNVTYKLNELTNQQQIGNGIHIRSATSKELHIVERLARSAFAGYRTHYHANKRLDKRKCEEVYVNWAKRCCVNRDVASEFLILSYGGQDAGFGTFKKTPRSSKGEGPLFGVVPDFRRQGLFKFLLTATIELAVDTNCSSFEYSTQVSNLIAQKALVRSGFHPLCFQHTFHKWYTK